LLTNFISEMADSDREEKQADQKLLSDSRSSIDARSSMLSFPTIAKRSTLSSKSRKNQIELNKPVLRRDLAR
jgi:hypothetical protein